MKAFGDSVVAGETPHSHDFFRPGGEGLAELNQLRQAGLAQLVNSAQKARRQLLALFTGAVPVTTHQRQQAPILGPHAILVSPTGQEVMIDQANDMKPVGHNARVGEVLPD